MNYKHCSVIDQNQLYQTFVLVLLDAEDVEHPEKIQSYTLKAGESLLDAAPPTLRIHAATNGLVTPRWNGNTWEEAATPQELADWATNHPAPVPDPTAPTTPTIEQRTEALEMAMLAVLGMGGEANA